MLTLEECHSEIQMLKFDLEEMTEARQRDRQRLRRVLARAKQWREEGRFQKYWFHKTLLVEKERDAYYAERDELRRRLHDSEVALDENRKMVTSANKAAGEAAARLEEAENLLPSLAWIGRRQSECAGCTEWQRYIHRLVVRLAAALRGGEGK